MMQPPLLLHRGHKDVSVAEDWYQTINGLIRVSIMQYTHDRSWRVCVWGGDDEGREIDNLDEQHARMLFDRIGHLVTKAALAEWGFVRA